MREQLGSTPATRAADRTETLPEESDVQEPVLALVRHRLVNFSTMSGLLRLLVVLTLVQLVLIGVLTALHDMAQPMLEAMVGGSHALAIPTIAFGVGYLSFALAWSALMTGALHGHWITRVLAVALFTVVVFIALGDIIISTTDPATQELQSPFRAQLLWLPLLALPLVVAVWALIVWIVLRGRARAGKPGRSGDLAVITFVVMLVTILACFLLCAGYLGLSRRADAFPTILADELWLLSYPLLPALLFTGTDYAEWGEAIAGRLIPMRGRPHTTGLLALLTALLCLAVLIGVPALILVPGVQLAGNGDAVPRLLFGSFLLDLALIATLALVIWLGRVRRWPRLRVSFGALLLSTLAVTLATALVLIGGPLGILLGIVLWPVLGLVLVIRGRWQPGGASAAGLYLIVVGLSVLAFAGAIGAFGQSALAALGGVQLAVALFTLAALARLALRGQLDAKQAHLIARLFVLNGGLLLIGVLYGTLSNVGMLSHGFGLVPAVLIVLAFLWDFLTSGEEVTNIEGRHFPRHARILIYSGYTMLVSTMVLFFAPVTADTIIDQPDLFFVFNPDLWPRYGLLLLGVPLLVTSFVLSISRGRSAQRSAQPLMPQQPYAAYPAYPDYPPQPGFPPPYPPPAYPPQPGYGYPPPPTQAQPPTY